MEQSPVFTDTKLHVGRRIHYPGHMQSAECDGVIVAVHGTPIGPSSRAGQVMQVISPCNFDAVLIDGRTMRQTNETAFYGARPWRFLDKVHGPELIAAMQRKAVARTTAEAIQRADANQQHTDNVARLIAENPHLTPITAANKYGNTVGTNLRAALKRAGLKAGVRKSTGSMCSTYYVRLVAGTTDAQLAVAQEIGDRFELGTFNGMTDSYDYDKHNAWCDAFGGVRFVFVERERAP